MSDKRRKIIEKINSLTVDFAFFLRNDICKTDSDYEWEIANTPEEMSVLSTEEVSKWPKTTLLLD